VRPGFRHWPASVRGRSRPDAVGCCCRARVCLRRAGTGGGAGAGGGFAQSEADQLLGARVLFDELSVLDSSDSEYSLSQQPPGSMATVCVSDRANPPPGILPPMETREAWLADDALGGRGLEPWAVEAGSSRPGGEAPRGPEAGPSFVPTPAPGVTSTDSVSLLLGSIRSLGSIESPSSPPSDASPVHDQADDSVLSLGSFGSYKWQSSLLGGDSSEEVHFLYSVRGQTMDSLVNVGGSKSESLWIMSEMCSDRLSQDVGSTSALHNSGVGSAQQAALASLQLASVQSHWERVIPGSDGNVGKDVVMEDAERASGANGASSSYPTLFTPCFAAQHQEEYRLQAKEEESSPAWAGHKRKCLTSDEEGTLSKRMTPPGNTPSAGMDGTKNKNCHYCEHAPKRASFFACSSCEQAFCENCNTRHLRAPTYFTGQADANRAAWLCPICAQKCCCTLSRCDKTHLHCKRYRRKLKTIKGALLLKPIQSRATGRSIECSAEGEGGEGSHRCVVGGGGMVVLMHSGEVVAISDM